MVLISSACIVLKISAACMVLEITVCMVLEITACMVLEISGCTFTFECVVLQHLNKITNYMKSPINISTTA